MGRTGPQNMQWDLGESFKGTNLKMKFEADSPNGARFPKDKAEKQNLGMRS